MTFATAVRSLPGTDRAIRRTPNLAHALATTAAAPRRGPGSVVLTHSPNCPDLLTVMYAMLRAGAGWAPTNFRLDADDVVDLARHARPALLICHRECQEHAEALPDLPTWSPGDNPVGGSAPDDGDDIARLIISEHDGGRRDAHVPRADDPAWLFFTSGSSGSPKAAVLSHDHLQFVVTNHLADLKHDLRSTDGTLVVAPLSHGAGVHVISHVDRGARVVLLPERRLDPVTAWRLVEQERVSTMFTVPTILNRLAQDRSVEHSDHSSLRYVIYAGAPIAAMDLRKDLEALGPVLVQYCGLGEVTGNITVLPTWKHEPLEPGSIAPAGYTRTGMQVSIQDEFGNKLTPGERGEICVCGPAVVAGYLDNDVANAKAFRDGWFRTSDLGYVDESGLLYITGRDTDMYISGGSNIDPREVEEKVLKHPDVAQVGVVGVPDPQWVEVGYAVCVVRDGASLDPATLEEWCRVNMPPCKAPRRGLVVDELPTAGYGKVTKNLLRALLEERAEWPVEADAS